MEPEVQPQSISTSTSNTKLFLAVGLSVLLTALIVGSGVYYWMSQKQTVINKEIDTVQSWGSQNNVDEIKEELIKAKLRLRFAQTGYPFGYAADIWVDPQNKNKFYYVVQCNINNEDARTICIDGYDFSLDEYYEKTGDISGRGTIKLYTRTLEDPEISFMGVGVFDNKFVFAEGNWGSPGPCQDIALFDVADLYSMDLSVSNSTPKPYTLPKDIKKSREQEGQKCLKELEESLQQEQNY